MRNKLLLLCSLSVFSASSFAEAVSSNGSMENIIEQLNNLEKDSDSDLVDTMNIIQPPGPGFPLMGCRYKIKTVHVSQCNYVALATDVTDPFTGEVKRKIGHDVKLTHTKEDSHYTPLFGRDPNYSQGAEATGRQTSGEPTQCAIGPKYFQANTMFYKYVNGVMTESKRVYFTAEYHLEAYPKYTSTPYYESEQCYY